MTEVDLDEVLRLAARRDPDALSTLVEMYSARVFGLLYRLSGSRETAEDLMQETFLRVVRTIDQYEHSGKFEAWLFRIAANLARDRARQGQRRGRVVSLGMDAGEPGEAGDLGVIDSAAPEESPERHMMQQEAHVRLEACLARLNEREREILMLRHFSGLSFPEIARMLGIPLGTALARAHRALGHLREKFGAE